MGERRVMIRIPEEMWEDAELTRVELGRKLGFKLSLNDFVLHQLRKAIDEAKSEAPGGAGSGLSGAGKGKIITHSV